MNHSGTQNRVVLLALAAMLLFRPGPRSVGAQTRLRLATLLSQGSSQYHALEEMGQQWKTTTGGALTLTL